MRRLTLFLLAVLCTALPCCALEISGPDEVDLKTPAWYSLDDVSEGVSVVWLPVTGADLQTGAPHICDGHALFWASSKGQYPIHAIVVDFDARTVKQITKVVSVGADDGDDGDDDSDPTPPLRDLVIGLIEERDHAASQGLEGSKLAQHVVAVQLYLKKLGVRTETLDDDQQAAAGYVGHLESRDIGSRPALVVSAISDDGSRKYLKAFPFGKDAQATIAALAAAGVK